MSISSLKKLSAIKLSLTESNINKIKKCLPQEVYEYYLDIKEYHRKCGYCKNYFFSYGTDYCSYECWRAYDNRLFRFTLFSIVIIEMLVLMIKR